MPTLHEIVKNNDDNDFIWCLFIISKTSFTINMFIQNISKANYAYTTFKQWYILQFDLQILPYFKMYYDTFGGLKICLLDSNLNLYRLISQVYRIFINVDNPLTTLTTVVGLSLWWRRNEHDSVSHHQLHDCLLSTVNSDADQRKHQSSASLAFVRRIHRGPVNSPHKWPVTRKMFPFGDVIMILIR